MLLGSVYHNFRFPYMEHFCYAHHKADGPSYGILCQTALGESLCRVSPLRRLHRNRLACAVVPFIKYDEYMGMRKTPFLKFDNRQIR